IEEGVLVQSDVGSVVLVAGQSILANNTDADGTTGEGINIRTGGTGTITLSADVDRTAGNVIVMGDGTTVSFADVAQNNGSINFGDANASVSQIGVGNIDIDAVGTVTTVNLQALGGGINIDAGGDVTIG